MSHGQSHALTRTLRIAVAPYAARADTVGPKPLNGLTGWNGSVGAAGFVELDVVVEGHPSTSGYLVDITTIDAAFRDVALRHLADAARRQHPDIEPVPALLRAIATDAAPLLPLPIAELTLRQSPYRTTTVRFSADLRHEPDAMHTTLITETFEFAAAHRLHLPELSDEENRRLFGKCNNPNGHGHNYRIEVACRMGAGAHGFGFRELQQLTDEEVLRRFDHKHLNLDCPEFSTLNPSVENIARVCFEVLEPRVREQGSALEYVRVWETDKTSCRYPA